METVKKSSDCLSGKRLSKKDFHRYAKVVLVGVLMGEGVTILLLFLFSLIMCRVEIPLLAADVLVVLAAVFGAFGTGYSIGRILREKGLLLGFCGGAVILLIMLLFSVGFRQPVPVALLCIKVAAVLLGSALGGVLGVNHKKRVKY